MEVYGDDCKITPGLIQGDQYSFLVDSKTALFVQEPADRKTRVFAGFFLAFPLAIAIGAFLDGSHYVVVLPCLVIAGFAVTSLVKSYRKNSDAAQWKLWLGAGENPALIYSDADATAFAAKRNEIEQALLGRPLSEEK